MMMSNICDGDKVVHPPKSGSFLHGRKLVDLEARANGIKHFGHDHVLTFKEDIRNGFQGKDLCCNICGIETGSRGFSCNMKNCKFLLHEFCALLPEVMADHPKHSEHPLILQSPDHGYCKSNCNVCDDRFRHYLFCYQCVDCNFSVDLRCASMSILVYNYDIHLHQLNAQLHPLSFMCHYCGEKHTELGISYQCRTCQFWLHEECSSLPLVIEHGSHGCQLRLYYFRFKWGKFSPKFTCGVCNKNIDQTINSYCCERCNYFVHIKCSTEEWDPEFEMVEQDQVKDIFPLSSPESVQKRLAQFIQNKCEWKDVEDKNGDILNHPAHDHPLILEFDSSKFIRSVDSEDIAKRLGYNVCNACILPLLDAPHYSCTQSCNFILHQWCAKLPRELKHPAHIGTGHTLILHEKLDKCFGFFRCKGCHEIGNRFAYKCNECEEYCLDVRCATLPSLVYYGTHAHHLRLKHRRISGGCISCCKRNFHDCEMSRCILNLFSTDNFPCSPPFLFGCDACHYNICIYCVTLPEKVLHWYDQHGFKLKYLADVPNHNDNTNLSYHCEFCENEPDTKKWIYHCAECDQCVEARCVSNVFGLLPIPIKLSESYDSPYHKELGHKLICLRITEELGKWITEELGNCYRCKKYCFRYEIGFACVECKIVLSLECASNV